MARAWIPAVEDFQAGGEIKSISLLKDYQKEPPQTAKEFVNLAKAGLEFLVRRRTRQQRLLQFHVRLFPLCGLDDRREFGFSGLCARASSRHIQECLD